MEYDPRWAEAYRSEESRIYSALGDRALLVEHTGSTAVPGLAAKPVIDITLAVGNSADEPAYAPDLERVGYQLRIREPDWYEHRLFRDEAKTVNLHVFTAGSEEIDRMIRFRDLLRSSPTNRTRYETTKRALAEQSWTTVQDYADAKSEVIAAILAE
ncbi:MAG TPA: GrpB family protein [Acidimicrobiia bacterium]